MNKSTRIDVQLELTDKYIQWLDNSRRKGEDLSAVVERLLKAKVFPVEIRFPTVTEYLS